MIDQPTSKDLAIQYLEKCAAEAEQSPDGVARPGLEALRWVISTLREVEVIGGMTDQPASREKRYEIQAFRDPLDDSSAYRITDRTSDSRIATCYVQTNAELVCDALNRASHEPMADEQIDYAIRRIEECELSSDDSEGLVRMLLELKRLRSPRPVCPFCRAAIDLHSVESWYFRGDGPPPSYAVRCDSCGAQGPYGNGTRRKDHAGAKAAALRLWNQLARASDLIHRNVEQPAAEQSAANSGQCVSREAAQSGTAAGSSPGERDEHG